MIQVLVTGTSIATVALVAVVTRPLRFVFKPLASAGFVSIAIAAGAAETTYGTWVLVGLILGAIGDTLLLGRSDAMFIGGLASFLLGHLSYVVALAPTATDGMALSAAVALTLAVTSWRWIRAGIPATMISPVAAYVLVISLMVFVAIASAATRPLAAVGAALFAVSDLLVARERFLDSSIWNARIGLPLYYAGQVLIALSVAV